MHQVARLSFGGMLWLLVGCSDVGNGTTHTSTGTGIGGGSSSKGGVAGSNSDPESNVTTSGGTTSTTTVAGDSLGGASATSLGGSGELGGAPGGTGGVAGATTLPLSNGGTTGAGGVTVLEQGGSMSTGGAAGLPTAGAAGQSAQASETLAQVMARFCALNDVMQCSPQCLAERQAEAANFPQCRELYRRLMACQVELPASLRTCDAGTVVTKTRCASEDETYWTCVTGAGG